MAWSCMWHHRDPSIDCLFFIWAGLGLHGGSSYHKKRGDPLQPDLEVFRYICSPGVQQQGQDLSRGFEHAEAHGWRKSIYKILAKAAGMCQESEALYCSIPKGVTVYRPPQQWHSCFWIALNVQSWKYCGHRKTSLALPMPPGKPGRDLVLCMESIKYFLSISLLLLPLPASNKEWCFFLHLTWVKYIPLAGVTNVLLITQLFYYVALVKNV